MAASSSEQPDLDVRPAGARDFPLVEQLFGPSGACAGCWCMWPRLTGREFAAEGGAGTRALLRTLVDDGDEPGLLALHDDLPVGWVAVAPRTHYGRMLRSPLVRPNMADVGPGSRDDEDVWAIVCFYVDRDWRGSGVTDVLAASARDHALGRGAHAVEGYPVEPAGDSGADELFHGTPGIFERADFTHVAAMSERRSLWRHATGAASDSRVQ